LVVAVRDEHIHHGRLRPHGERGATRIRASTSISETKEALERIREPLYVLRDPATGAISAVAGDVPADHRERVGALPPLYPEWLGDRAFTELHGLRFPYVTGAMANGIATPRLVVAIARAGMLGFFGAAGLSFERVEAGLDEIERRLEGQPVPWGANLIHSPNEPELEDRVADLYVRRGVLRVEASAFLGLTPSVVRVACSGLRVASEGRIARRHHVFAKISRPEVARQFMSPPPADMLRALVDARRLTAEEAALAARVPLATDITVEADSGGHTDNRPLGALLPVMLSLRDQVEAKLELPGVIRIGAAGGLGTPSSVAAAFALGAAYVLTGTVNQCAVESGLSDEGKRMLAEADIADVAMAAAADMFELGVRVQVLKRGTLFAARANRLYELYRAHESLEDLPAGVRSELETRVFGAPIETVWNETQAFWRERDPKELERASSEPKHRMALTFRTYLGLSSRWAISGESGRSADFQIWCGPAMGAFNDWVKGSFLEPPEARSVVQIALNLLEGAAVVTRAQELRSFGVPVAAGAFRFRPRRLSVGSGTR
jgi:PfaD family protein